MSFDFSTLVTDRTQADVNRVKQIAEKIKNGTASESELAEFNSAAMKGAYNYTDLNRVTAAMDALKTKLEGYGYAVPGYQRIKIDHVIPGASRLPEGYTELAWIESTGTQYIDSLYKPTSEKLRIVADFTWADVSSGKSVIAMQDSTRTDGKWLVWYMESNGNLRHYIGNTNGLNMAVTAGTNYLFDITADNGTLTAVRNGTTQTMAYSGTIPKSYPIAIFGNNANGKITHLSSVRMRSVQIYDNSVLVRDFVPCKNTSGVFGLYDLVNGVFYQNAGSGAFTAGEEIAPPADVPDVNEFDPYLWYEFDWPTPQTMTIYLLNVSAIRAVLDVMESTPAVPADMERLLMQEANNIEIILSDVLRQLTIMPTTFIPCGEALCGGDNL